ncbi:YigZ family protein [Aggregatimonas sangjinii]|nr:YigZ family protein [Aggregatimonas sangjinii]
MQTDTYKTISRPSAELLYKERKSKFYGNAYPIQTEEEVKPLIEALRKKHRTANHVCYAWQLGVENPRYRANDDGEPNNSAGMPIYGQIQSFEVTNVLVTVTRIFGGTKLGVGGLIGAYRETARLSLDAADIVERILEQSILLHFGYPQMEKVMRTIKQDQITIVAQRLEIDCELLIAIQKSRSKEVLQKFQEMYGVAAKFKTF